MPETNIAPEALSRRYTRIANATLTKKDFMRLAPDGWLDADTMDSEYSGHAIWQTQPPCEADWQLIFDGGHPRYEPTDIQLSLVQSGEDFTAAMGIARMNIGSALFINEMLAADNVADDDYWMHVATAMLWLGIASDRIRDYLTLSCFGMMADKYPFDRKNDTWATPFAKVTRSHVDEEPQLVRLASLAEVVRGHRNERHGITHLLATRAAKRTIAVLVEQQQHARMRVPYPPPTFLSFEDLSVLETNTEPSQERKNAFQKLGDWYVSLAEVSNIVFQIEYERRGTRN